MISTFKQSVRVSYDESWLITELFNLNIFSLYIGVNIVLVLRDGRNAQCLVFLAVADIQNLQRLLDPHNLTLSLRVCGGEGDLFFYGIQVFLTNLSPPAHRYCWSENH